MYYFAYGSNMNQTQMKKRCPNSKFIRRAKIEGFNFVYDGYSKTWEGATANIVKDDGIVWGGLYEISEDCLSSLDIFEGYPDVYDKDNLSVKDDEQNPYQALVYLRSGKLAGNPHNRYRKTVIQGALECGLPEEYIKKKLAQ